MIDVLQTDENVLRAAGPWTPQRATALWRTLRRIKLALQNVSPAQASDSGAATNVPAPMAWANAPDECPAPASERALLQPHMIVAIWHETPESPGYVRRAVASEEWMGDSEIGVLHEIDAATGLCRFWTWGYYDALYEATSAHSKTRDRPQRGQRLWVSDAAPGYGRVSMPTDPRAARYCIGRIHDPLMGRTVNPLGLNVVRLKLWPHTGTRIRQREA